jgi:flavin-dependent dehydrogenase
MSHKTEYDIAIVGGGLAGCAAAITLLQSEPRTRVLVLERGTYPRHKVCGEFVSPEGMAALARLLGTGKALDLAAGVPPIAQANIHVDGRVLSAPIRPAAASITRLDLDFVLWQHATQLGADCREKNIVLRVENNGLFEIQLEDERVRANALINAAGRWSFFTQSLLKPTNGLHNKWIGLKSHFNEPSSSGAIDLYLFEGGYCGVQPVAVDRVNACAMVRVDRASTLAEVCALHPKLRERSGGWRPLMDPVTTAPLYFRNPVPVENGVFNAGDAAGFIDPFVGDGMTLALHSGILAGKALAGFAQQHCDLRAAARNYSHEYKTRLFPAFRRARWVRRMIYLPGVVRVPLGRLIQMTGATESLLKATRIAG